MLEFAIVLLSIFAMAWLWSSGRVAAGIEAATGKAEL